MVAKESSRESLASGTWRTPSKDKLLHNMIPRINLPKSTNQQISIVIAFWDCFFWLLSKNIEGSLEIFGFLDLERFDPGNCCAIMSRNKCWTYNTELTWRPSLSSSFFECKYDIWYPHLPKEYRQHTTIKNMHQTLQISMTCTKIAGAV